MNINEARGYFDKGYYMIEKKNLPSRGLFYDDAFQIYITKIPKHELYDFYRKYTHHTNSIESDIIYKNLIIFGFLKTYLKFTKKYTYKHIKVYDMLYLALVLIDFTIDGGAHILYGNGDDSIVYDSFRKMNLCLTPLSKYMDNYDIKKKSFNINGYNYSPPSIGVHKSIIDIVYRDDNVEPTSVFVFQYFLKYNKVSLKDNEAYNFMTIFDGFPDNEIKKMNDIIQIFASIGRGILLGSNESYVLNHNTIYVALRNYYKNIDNKSKHFIKS